MKKVRIKIVENQKTLIDEIYEYLGQNENYIYLKGKNGFTHYQIKPLFGAKMPYTITVENLDVIPNDKIKLVTSSGKELIFNAENVPYSELYVNLIQSIEYSDLSAFDAFKVSDLQIIFNRIAGGLWLKRDLIEKLVGLKVYVNSIAKMQCFFESKTYFENDMSRFNRSLQYSLEATIIDIFMFSYYVNYENIKFILSKLEGQNELSVEGIEVVCTKVNDSCFKFWTENLFGAENDFAFISIDNYGKIDVKLDNCNLEILPSYSRIFAPHLAIPILSIFGSLDILIKNIKENE